MTQNTENDLRLAIRVGITGHRVLDQQQVDDIRARVRQVLEMIKNQSTAITTESTGYSAEPPLLRVIAPIAEGADRIVAREGINHGYELQSPLPYPRDEYRNDFSTPESQGEFDDLLSRATAVFELDGSRSDEPLAYQTVGRVMLAQSDLIIAIWDGQPAKGPGGTAEIVADAASQEIPVVWIQPSVPGSIRLRLCIGDEKVCVVEHEQWKEKLVDVLDQLLLSPKVEDHQKGCIAPSDFADCLRGEWPKKTIQSEVWKYFVKALAYSSNTQEPSPTAAATPPVEGQPFENEYERADAPANYFAELYRGSLVLNNILGAFAVVLALMVLVVPRWQPLWFALELTTIVAIISLIFLANRRRWHQKSIDCRYYAEQLRQMRYLWPLARVTPSSRPPIHLSFGDPRGTAMNWRFRAVLRMHGMATAKADTDYVLRCEKLQSEWIEGQIAYHRKTSERLARVDNRLHRVASVLFLITVAACVGHLAIHEGPFAAVLTLLTAALPAVAAAAHAISSHTELRRITDRSDAMAKGLAGIKTSLDSLQSSHPNRIAELYRLVSPGAAAMMDEVTDWRILFGGIPLDPA